MPELSMKRAVFTILMWSTLAAAGNAQADDMCREYGVPLPSLNSPFANIPYVYGRVTLKGFDPNKKTAKVTVIFWDREQSETRLNLGKSGYYCFKRNNASGGLLVVEVDGNEAARRSLPSFGPTQQREDFEIFSNGSQRPAAAAVISAKFSHPQNEKTVELYRKAADAEKHKDPKKLVEMLKEIVSVDPADFIAWAKLGSVYFELNSLSEADSAFRKSIESKLEYTPAWINVGKIRVAQKQLEAAIEIFKHAATLDPTSARTFQLLGETYLQARKGTLGAEALKKALELDPIGMAECHLLLARLYDLAGAKDLATREFKLFLQKRPDHPDKKKLEEYIKQNPE